MIGIILFLIPKILAVFLAWVAFRQSQRAQRKNRVIAYHYWLLGMTGYNIVISWTWGWLQDLVWVPYFLCALGYSVSMILSTCKDRKAYKVACNGIAKQIQAIHSSLEAQIPQIGQEQGEIISALDHTQSWQADESKDSLFAMEMAQRYFNEHGGSYHANRHQP